jgi:hypothetical protein
MCWRSCLSGWIIIATVTRVPVFSVFATSYMTINADNARDGDGDDGDDDQADEKGVVLGCWVTFAVCSVHIVEAIQTFTTVVSRIVLAICTQHITIALITLAFVHIFAISTSCDFVSRQTSASKRSNLILTYRSLSIAASEIVGTFVNIDAIVRRHSRTEKSSFAFTNVCDGIHQIRGNTCFIRAAVAIRNRTIAHVALASFPTRRTARRTRSI